MKHLWWSIVFGLAAIIGVITWRRHVSQSNSVEPELSEMSGECIRMEYPRDPAGG